MTSIIKYIYNVYKKLNAGCNSTEVVNSVEKQTDEIIVSVTSDVQEIHETIADRTRANTMYEETKTSINENVEQFVSQGIDVIDAIHTTLTEVPLESAPEPVVESIPDSTEESIQEPANEPIQETIKESIQEPANEPIHESIPEPIQEPANEPVVEPTPEPIQESIPESIQESIPEPIQETIEESIQETIEESIQETIEESIQEPANEPIKESIPETTPEPIQEDQQSEYSSIHSPPPSPEYSYTDYQTEIIGVVVDTDESFIINSSKN